MGLPISGNQNVDFDFILSPQAPRPVVFSLHDSYYSTLKSVFSFLFIGDAIINPHPRRTHSVYVHVYVYHAYVQTYYIYEGAYTHVYMYTTCIRVCLSPAMSVIYC